MVLLRVVYTNGRIDSIIFYRIEEESTYKAIARADQTFLLCALQSTLGRECKASQGRVATSTTQWINP